MKKLEQSPDTLWEKITDLLREKLITPEQAHSWQMQLGNAKSLPDCCKILVQAVEEEIQKLLGTTR